MDAHRKQDPEVVDASVLASKYGHDRRSVCAEYFETGKQYASFCDATCFPRRRSEWCARQVAAGGGDACERLFAPGRAHARQCDKRCGYGFCVPHRGASTPCNQSLAYPYVVTAFDKATAFDGALNRGVDGALGG